ncbi:MAG: hypothetical protein ACRCZI_03120 [Cetobacterium sp.]
MSNPNRGDVSFDASGKTWKLKFSTNAICELEDAIGIGVDSIASSMQNESAQKMKLLRAVLWAAMQDHHEGITKKQVGDLIDEIGFEVATQKMTEAFAAAFPESKGGSQNPTTAATV